MVKDGGRGGRGGPITTQLHVHTRLIIGRNQEIWFNAKLSNICTACEHICMFYTRIKTCLLLRGDLESDLLHCLGDGLRLGDRLRLFSWGEEEGLRLLDLDLDFNPE